jgi:hypothetical protein
MPSISSQTRMEIEAGWHSRAQATPTPVKIYKIADYASCSYIGCTQAAEYGVRRVNEAGGVSAFGEDLCDWHYEQEILERDILVVD